MKTLFKQLLPYVIVGAVVAGSIYWVHSEIGDSYDNGFNAGVAKQKQDQLNVDTAERDRRESEKEQIERQAQASVEAAHADAAHANASRDRMFKELEQIKRITENNSIIVAPGVSTSEAVRLLANLLEERTRAHGETAQFADAAFNAGQTCINQYNSLRGKYEEAQQASYNRSN